MAEIINLKHVRKEWAKAEEVRQAEENRLRHGRTKAEKTRDREEAKRAAETLDGKKID
jgi:uncharacterized protein YifN (PemK superfamily)